MTGYAIAWLILSVAGLFLAVLGVVDAWRDLRALRVLPRNGRWLVARHQLIRGVLRVLVFAVYVAAIAVPLELIAPLLVASNLALVLTALSDTLTGAFLRRGVRAELSAAERELERASQ